MKLDLGCGNNKPRGYIGIDLNERSMANILYDLNKTPYPIKGESIKKVRCFHVLEHLKNPLDVLLEIYRICERGAVVEIKSPHFTNVGAYHDPTHLHYFSINSFDYLIEGTKKRKDFSFYGSKSFKLINKKINFPKWYKFLEPTLNNIRNLYEQSFLRSFFPARDIEIKLKKP